MKPEQLNWTDKQWAEHLKCSATDVPRLKKYLEENFCLVLWQEKDNSLKYIEVQARHDTPSGNLRYVPMVVSQAFDISLNDLVQYTNNTFIPSLVLKPHVAKMRGVPSKILQMLHINEKQK